MAKPGTETKKPEEKKLKLIIPAGKAVPGQQLGPALGQAGIPIGDFVKKFNEATAAMGDVLVPVEITVKPDRTYKMVFKTPPASSLLLKAAKVEKGSGKNVLQKAGKVTKAQVRAIAEQKLPDLNATDIEAAIKIIEGSARSMGIEVQ